MQPTIEHRSIRYLAPLDGIRAVAIIGVLIFHISPSALKGGFVGVDVFFVLSGFLIASILLNDIREGRFSIREFYLRRIQRLLPNVIVTVLAVLVLWTIFLPPSTARSTASHGLWTLFNASNIYIWRNLGGYWGNSAEWSPLTHTWSLGIEEQFYLFFPCSLLLLARFQPGRVGSWLSAATVLSFGICLYGTHRHPVPTFYLLPTRVWELLIGAILATHRTPLRSDENLLARPLGAKSRAGIGWTGLGMILGSFILINESSSFPGWVSLIPTAGTILLLMSVAEGETGLSRLLSSRFMVGVGKLSYSLYLWHWPLITLGKIQADFHGYPRLVGATVGGLCGIILGWVAYIWVEQPLRSKGPGRRWRVATMASGFVLVVLYSSFIASRHPVADPAHRFDTPTFSIRLFDAGRDVDPSKWFSSIAAYDLFVPPPPLIRPDAPWKTGGIIHLYGEGHPKIVVLGSSHALMYSKVIDDICRNLQISVAFLGAGNGSTVFFESKINANFSSLAEAREFDDTRRKYLREWHPEAVFIIDRWDDRCKTPEEFNVKLKAFLREVSPLTKRVIFVAQVPVHQGGDEVNLREIVTSRMGKGEELPRLRPDLNDELRKQVAVTAESLVTDFRNLRVLRADVPFYLRDGSIRYAEGRNFFYADDDHLTDAGSEVIRGLFQEAIEEAHAGAPSI